MTTYYVSNGGGGSGATPESPFKFSNLWGVVGPDDVALVLDGTFTGANSMISPTPGLSGTSGHPIRISAINDGQVLIDGQSARPPIELINNDWLIIEGVNAKAADVNSNVVHCDPNSANNIFRRVCAWDAGDTHAVFNDEGTNNLFEDVVGFGRGRKIYGNSQGSVSTTYRRAFGMFNYSSATNGPKEVFSNSYNSHGGTYENCIATWDADPSHPAHSDEFGLFIFERMNDIYPDICAAAKYLGCIGYVLSTQTASIDEGALQGGTALDCIEFKDVAVYIDNAAKTASLPNLASIYGGPSSGNHIITNSSEIRVAGNSSLVESDWTQVNRKTASSVAGIYGTQNLYVNDGNKGATIRYRYVNRVLTSDELFPWPMNQRIKDAFVLAGRTAHDVNATIQSIFGTFPTASGDPNPGILVGDPSHGELPPGVDPNTAIGFDGLTQYVKIGSSADYNFDSQFSLEVWAFPTALGGTLFANQNAGSSPTGSVVLSIQDTGRLRLSREGIDYVESTGFVTVNSWNHIVVTFDPSQSPNTNFFINGTNVGAADLGGTFTPNSEDVLIGGNGAGDDLFQGALDEAAVFQTVLLPPRVQAHTEAMSVVLQAKFYTHYLPRLIASGVGVTGGSATPNATWTAENNKLARTPVYILEIQDTGLQGLYSAEVLADDPAGFWRFGESTGTMTLDSSAK